MAGQEKKGGETDFSKEAKETKTIKDQEEGRDSADDISLADRPQILKRLSALPALKQLDISPEAVLEITEQIRPAIRETAQAF